MNEKAINSNFISIINIGNFYRLWLQQAKKEEPKISVNTEKDVVKDQTVDGIKMTNTSLTTVNGVSTLVTKVTNDTAADYELKEYKIIIKDENGNVITTIPGYVGTTIKAGETRVIDSSTNADLSGAKSVEYEVSK